MNRNECPPPRPPPAPGSNERKSDRYSTNLQLPSSFMVPIEEEIVQRIERVRKFESFRLFTERMALIDHLINIIIAPTTHIHRSHSQSCKARLKVCADVPYNNHSEDTEMDKFIRSQAAQQLLNRLILHRNERDLVSSTWNPEVPAPPVRPPPLLSRCRNDLLFHPHPHAARQVHVRHRGVPKQRPPGGAAASTCGQGGGSPDRLRAAGAYPRGRTEEVGQGKGREKRGQRALVRGMSKCRHPAIH